ncbi:MAG: DUF502 domain-containing protein [Desulfomonile tiedjei]|nr:DUF502 domain-containing protein [Desulfomonile tiedjei]
MQTMLRFFFTGVATLLPFAVTVFLVSWLVRITDAYVGPSSTFGAFLVTISGTQYKYSGYIVGYLVVVLLIILLGFLVNRATVSRLHRAVDRTFARIPLFGKIYATVGQMVEIFGQKGQGGLDRFGGVGQIRMGNVKMLGLLTSRQRYLMPDGREYFLLFVPNSPIPATGFNVFVPVEDFELLDMAVEDLAKVLMSLGLLGSQVLRPPVQPVPVKKVQDGPETV